MYHISHLLIYLDSELINFIKISSTWTREKVQTWFSNHFGPPIYLDSDLPAYQLYWDLFNLDKRKSTNRVSKSIWFPLKVTFFPSSFFYFSLSSSYFFLNKFQWCWELMYLNMLFVMHYLNFTGNISMKFYIGEVRYRIWNLKASRRSQNR